MAVWKRKEKGRRKEGRKERREGGRKEGCQYISVLELIHTQKKWLALTIIPRDEVLI